MGFLSKLFRALRKRKAYTPATTPPRPSPPPPRVWDEARVFPVWVARSQEEWESFPRAFRGLGAIYWHSEPFTASGAGFNFDAFPIGVPSGVHAVSVVLEAARREDRAEGRAGNLREDFILHEIGGHGVLGVGADHDSPNPVMNGRNGPPTEAARQELRDAILGRFDAFRVHRGPPPK